MAVALQLLWETAGRICSKRLAPFLPELIEAMERHGRLTLAPATKQHLQSISPATIDRLLKEVRQGERRRGLSTTRSGSLLKGRVPVRTFFDWDERRPGFIEADLVAHCGTTMAGSYLHTVTMTDIATGWTETIAIPYRDQQMVKSAIKTARERFPFPMLGLDTDNGSEFLNRALIDYCQKQQITFTRSRPYKKNDQCHVEQKNSVVVRRFIGYDRFEGLPACHLMADLYHWLRLYVNYFQPSVKLISKHRVGGKVIKTFDQAQTPYRRVLEASSVSAETKITLQKQYEQLDPTSLMNSITAAQDALWERAWIPKEESTSTQKNLPIMRVAEGDVTAALRPSKSTRLEMMYPKDVEILSPDERLYRQSKRKGRYHLVVHNWRTRPDPFAEVNHVIERRLAEMPHLEAKTLFKDLQKQYPGKFKDGQLRTLQRRVKTWRMNQLAEMTREIGLILTPESP